MANALSVLSELDESLPEAYALGYILAALADGLALDTRH